MIPKTLSASAALVFENCEARYKAEYIDRGRAVGGTAANLGTACHEALENWINGGHHLTSEPFSSMEEMFVIAYRKLFSDDGRMAEGVEMLKRWYDRQDWEGRTVLSTERKETFDLSTSAGIIPVTYIWDRCDRLDDGSIEVVDYKSVIQPVQPEDLKTRIQPRLYALAAQIKYPEATSIWVAFDLLRYDVVATRFSVEENRDTYKYIKELAERVIASDGTNETLNPECRWCVRKDACDALTRHAAVGGTLGITDPVAAADRRAQLQYARDGLNALIGELDDVVLEYMEEAELTEFQTGATAVKAASRGTRTIDSERAAKILGPDIMSRYGKLGITQVETILKTETLTDSEKSQIKQLIRKNYGKVSLSTKPMHPFGDDD